jgi:chromosome segregation ATPase
MTTPQNSSQAPTTSMPMSRKEVAHMETINMMAKYQLVFAMLESYLGRILTSKKINERWLLLKSILHWKKTTELEMHRVRIKSSIAIQNVKTIIKKCICIFNSQARSKLRKSMHQWKFNSSISKLISTEEKKLKDGHLSLQKELNEKEATAKASTNKIQTLTKQISDLTEGIKKAEGEIKATKEKAKSLNEMLLKVNDDDVSISLRRQLLSLETENIELRQKIEATEVNIGSFIQDMTQAIVENQEEDQDLLNNAKIKPTAKSKTIMKH